MRNSFIFGGNTGETAEDLKRRRELAQSLIAGDGSAPRTVGEGLVRFSEGIAGGLLDRHAKRQQETLKAAGGNPPLPQARPIQQAPRGIFRELFSSGNRGQLTPIVGPTPTQEGSVGPFDYGALFNAFRGGR